MSTNHKCGESHTSERYANVSHVSLYSILDARLDGRKNISEKTHIHNALKKIGELEWCQFIS